MCTFINFLLVCKLCFFICSKWVYLSLKLYLHSTSLIDYVHSKIVLWWNTVNADGKAQLLYVCCMMLPQTQSLP